MGALSHDIHVEHVGPGIHLSVSDADAACVIFGLHMEPQHIVHLRMVHAAGLDHPLRSAHCLLRRLEEEFHAAVELILQLAHDETGDETNGNVGIMTAGVHYTGGPGSEGEAGLLMDGQCVHVRPDGNGLPGAGPGDERYDARVSHVILIGNAPFVQLGANQPAGFKLLFPQLGDPVERTPDPDDLLFNMVRSDDRFHVHASTPFNSR